MTDIPVQRTAEEQFQQDVLDIANRLAQLSTDREMVNGYVERKLTEAQRDLRAAVRRVRGLKP